MKRNNATPGTTVSQMESIAIGLLYRSAYNARGAMDEGALKDLIASVKEKGVLVPILVREKPDGDNATK